jgi:hypothetical protein
MAVPRNRLSVKILDAPTMLKHPKTFRSVPTAEICIYRTLFVNLAALTVNAK